jgi:hypothetical protein
MRERLRPETEELRRRSLASERMPAAYKRQLKGAVLARIALSAPGTLAAGQATASGTGLGVKVIVGLALVGALGAGSYRALRPARQPVHVDVQDRPEAPAGVAPLSLIEASRPLVVVTPAPKTTGHGKRVVDRGVFAAEPGTLPREVLLLGEADRALRAGNTAKATAILDEHAALFPKGTLAPERAAERLIVSCRVGDADPRAVANFLAATPGSPLAARVRRACALNFSAPVPRHP